MSSQKLTESEERVLNTLYHHSDWAYRQPWRKYHNSSHLNRMWRYIQEHGQEDIKGFCMNAAVMMHDYVYEPTRNDNEAESAKIFEKFVEETREKYPDLDIPQDKIAHVCNMINVTANPYVDKSVLTEDEKLLLEADWNGMMHWDTLDDEKIEFLDKWEAGIFKEFQMYPLPDYIRERLNFLKTAKDNGMITQAVYDYVRYRMCSKIYRVAVYAGTFCPFHRGHLSVLKQILQDYDKVIIAKGINADKIARPTNIHAVFPHLQTVEFDTLLPDFLLSLAAPNCRVTLIRGLRNDNDLTYETNIVKFLKNYLPSDLTNHIKTVWVPADPRYDFVSSTFVNGLPEKKRKRYLPKTPTY